MADPNIREALGRIDGASVAEEIMVALKAILDRVGGAPIAGDLEPEIQDIAYRASLYSARKALGEDVEENLREVRLHAGLVGATIERRLSERAAAAWKTGVDVVLDLVAGLLRRVLAP